MSQKAFSDGSTKARTQLVCNCPDAASGMLKTAKKSVTPNEYHIAGNMILSRPAHGSTAAHK